MKHLSLIIAFALTFTLTACGDSGTDKKLPEGEAPTSGSEKDDAGKKDTKDKPDDADNKGKEPGPHDKEPKVSKDDGKDKDPATEPDKNAEGKNRIKAAGLLTCALPEGWSRGGTNPSQFNRILTLLPPKEYTKVELAVTHWPNGVGTLQGNLFRWWVMSMKLPRERLAEAQKLAEVIDMGGMQATWVPLKNKDSGQAMIGIWLSPPGSPIGQLGPKNTFVIKVSGTIEQIEKLAPIVRKWAATVKLEKKND